MTVLVCGGAGYIGSHAVKRLLSAGRRVVVLDNLSTGHRVAVGETPFIQCDITRRESLGEVIRRYKINAVMHFAALCLVGESVHRPLDYYRHNLAGTLNLLEAMIENGVNKIVFSSTAAVYGDPAQIPIPEDHRRVPVNPYGATKLAAEEMIRCFGRAYGLRYVIFRYFNAAGADPDGGLGEDHNPETHLIPRILMAAEGLLPEITVLGADHPTPDGTCIRDYIHVNDLSDAHILALKLLDGGGEPAVYNLGSGRGFSVREVILAAEEVTGKKVRVAEGARRPGDPSILVASPEKAMRELGWKPRYGDLKTIIDTAWNWHRRHPGGYAGKAGISKLGIRGCTPVAGRVFP